MNPAERELQLVRALASWQIWWRFETGYNAILGSQLTLLQAANTRPPPVSQARAFYDDAAQAFPDYYATYAFDHWLLWLVEMAKAITVSDDTIYITEDGRELLKYAIGRGYPLTRFG